MYTFSNQLYINCFNRKPFDGYGPPASVFSLGVQQFRRNLDAIKGEYKDEEDISKLLFDIYLFLGVGLFHIEQILTFRYIHVDIFI